MAISGEYPLCAVAHVGAGASLMQRACEVSYHSSLLRLVHANQIAKSACSATWARRG